MAVIQQQPTFNQQAANIEHQKKLAQMLRSQAKYDMAPNASVSVGPYTNVVPMSPIAALAQGLREGVASYNDASASKQEAELADKKQQALSTMFSGENDPSMQDMAQSGLFEGDVLVNALLKKQQAKEAAALKAEERQQKLNDPTTGMREAIWASGGDDAKARELLQNKMLLPVWSFNANTQNMSADNTRQNQELEFRREELELRRQEALRKAEEARQPKPLSDFQQYKLDEERKAKEQSIKQAEFSAQSVLDQADTLYNHPGRLAGTGLSSFVSKVPGTDAKGFASQLDTFKAQTFIPMVSALKGMGALSDAEGKKLSESVGALDPSMPEQEFADSLKTITNTLARKAQIAGLKINIPKFADTGVSVDISPSELLSMPPEQRKQLEDEIAKNQKQPTQQPSEQQKVIRYDANGNRIQ